MNKNQNKIIGQYICNSREQLGRGLLCTVYQAKHYQTNQYVALKQIQKVAKFDRGLTGTKIKECYQLEVEILNKCKLKNHKNVVAILDYFETEHHYNIVLELCQYNLKQYLETKKDYRLDEQEAVDVLIQIVEGEKCLHELKYCHRDIKPENILIKDGCVKITDVNLAKQLDDIIQGKTDTLVGTKFYLAPELSSPIRKYSPYKADIYSLGIVFFEMLYGLKNKQQNNIIDVQKSISESKIKIDQDLTNLILQMVDPNPQNRADWPYVSSRLLEYTIKNKSNSESIKDISKYYIKSSQEELSFYEQMLEEIEHYKKDDFKINVLPSVLLILKQIRGLLVEQLLIENDKDNNKCSEEKLVSMTSKQQEYQKETKSWYSKEIEAKRQVLCQSLELKDEFKYQEKNHNFELHLQAYLANLFNQLNNLKCESKNNEFKKELLQLQLKLIIACDKNNNFSQVNESLVESYLSQNQQTIGFKYYIENPERLEDYINALKPIIDQILSGL